MASLHEPHIDRRKLLKQIALAPFAAAGLAACSADEKPRSRGKVIVVGAGLAGLRALDLLVAAGYDVSLLEAGPRSGGRVRTFRQGLPEGVWAEAGAERIRPTHHRMHALLRRFDLRARPYGPPPEPYFLDAGEKTARFTDQGQIPSSLTTSLSAVERTGFPGAVHLAVARSHPAPARDDARSAWQWLHDVGMSPEGARWVRAWTPWPLDRLPAATFHRYCLDEGESSAHAVTVEGGVDRVPAALARAHQHRITHNAPIARARVSADGVTLETVNGATHAAPWVIVCLPAKPLRALEIEGADTAALRRRLAALHTEDEVKVHLLVPGSAFGATAAASTVFRERFPRVTWPSPGRTLDGTRAINMMAVHDEVPPVQKQLARGKKSVRAWLANRMPRVATASTDVFWHDFAADPLAGGAWAWTPGDGGRPAGLPEQLGRLIIAGGDFSTLPGWMEGALQSAEDAVNLLKT